MLKKYNLVKCPVRIIVFEKNMSWVIVSCTMYIFYFYLYGIIQLLDFLYKVFRIQNFL